MHRSRASEQRVNSLAFAQKEGDSDSDADLEREKQEAVDLVTQLINPGLP